jgi:hypothetical protein
MFVPMDASVDTAAHVIRYDGDFDDIGDTIHLAGHTVELQHYAAAAYVELIGPTAMRFLDADGWRAFLADADLAHSAGIFTAPMTDARLRLADAEVFAEPFTQSAPVSVHARADGHMTQGAQGGLLGHVDAVDRALSSPRPRWAVLAGVVEPRDLVSDLSARPWLGRYVGAARLSSVLGLTSSDRIDGFGWRVLADADVAVLPRADDPFLVRTSEGLLLVDLRTRRRQRLSATTATVVATLQATVDPAEAAERLARTWSITAERARSLCSEAVDKLGVGAGVPPVASAPVLGSQA